MRLPQRCVYLVSCVGLKTSSPNKAKDLYVSAWFRKARRYVEQQGAPWFILSAEHGLVNPESVISPYERTLNRMGVGERRAWAERVIQQLQTALPASDEIVVFAGARYREHLTGYLKSRTKRVVVPLDGLRIGEQLSWLSGQENRQVAL